MRDRMGIQDLIRGAVRCVKCGDPIGCKCWVTLRCPTCMRTRNVERLPEDGDAAYVKATCPLCEAPENEAEGT